MCRSGPSPGQMVALVGSSGAGKSTIASLLPRLYDVDAGAVRIGGVDVRDLAFDTIRGALGLVTQDGHLFHESLRSNLLLARPDARRTPSCGTCCAAPASPTSSRRCPTGSTPWSASAATASPAASANA